jgi:hypothetical protein
VLRRIGLAIVGIVAGWLTASSVGASSPAETQAETARRLAFLSVLPTDQRAYFVDDLKLLLGWTSDAAAAEVRLREGTVIDAASGFAEVPGFAAPTPLGALRGRYRILAAPFTEGRSYYGIAFGALDASGRATAVILTDRLFRLPVVLREPVGLATDVVTNGGLIFGLETAGTAAAKQAAEQAFVLAVSRGVPLVTVGQSQAGGTAQLQVAALEATHGEAIAAGFITFNAAYAVASIERLGLVPERVNGVNFSKDRDPGVGPKSLLPNRVGVQIYVHPDGSGGPVPGDGTIFGALLHPREHFLDSFTDVELSPMLAAAMAAP